MNKKKILLLLILSIFIVGMVLSPASASHTFKIGKYKATVSDKKYKKMKSDAKKGKKVLVTLKTGKYKTYKKPKYKTVKKKKWKYKKVLRSEFWSWDGGSEWQDYDTWEKYTKKGWTWYGTEDKDKEYDDGSYYSAHYYKLKKKVITKVKVKDGYKKVKKPIYIAVGNQDEMGKVYKKLFVCDLYTDYGRLDVW